MMERYGFSKEDIQFLDECGYFERDCIALFRCELDVEINREPLVLTDRAFQTSVCCQDRWR